MTEPSASPRIVYCHCAYARVIPDAVKSEVLRGLSSSGVAFEAVADLCEMSARKDEALARLQRSAPIRVAACYPRAVRWLFHAAGHPLPTEGIDVLNMREQSAAEVLDRLLDRSAAADLAS